MDRKDKGKNKLTQPIKPKKSSSPMSIFSDEENTVSTEKLMHAAISAAQQNTQLSHKELYSYLQDSQDIESLSPLQFTQSPRIRPPRPSKVTHIPQFENFGNFSLQKCFDISKKFRPMAGIILTEKQQCLIDNLWHLQTLPQASNFKVQILNALSIYFQEQTQKQPEKQKQRFSHYVIFRGTKLGIFNKWETVAKYIQIPKPIFKGYYSFAEALKAARDNFGLTEFTIEPEEVKSYSEIATTKPEQLIKAQEDVIASLQQKVLASGKNTQITQIQIDNAMLQKQVFLLKGKLEQLTQALSKRDGTVTEIHRNYNSFKARILDMPWTQTMQPVLEHIPELEGIISSKVLTEFPAIFYNLQRKIVEMYFNEEQHPGVTVVQTLSNDGTPTDTLRLQINMKQTKMTDDDLLNFYHHGMIDYLEFGFNPRTENLLNKLGEKMILTAGNIATYTDMQVGCKIFASFPEATAATYRPARKRIFISHRPQEQRYLKTVRCTINLNLESIILKQLEETTAEEFRSWIEEEQKTPELPYSFKWSSYKLLAEGHYTQIWSHSNWDMLLPFTGESDTIRIVDINNKEDDTEIQSVPGTPPSIPDTHRDF